MTHAIINPVTKQVLKDEDGNLHIYSTKERAEFAAKRVVGDFKIVPW